MSSFTKPARLEMLDNFKWRLLGRFEYRIDKVEIPYMPLCRHDIRQNKIRVPRGTVTDLTSVPRLLWSVFPPHGRFAKAAIIHDYLYDQAIGTKAFADQVFLEAMTVLGVPRATRILMYWAVRLFGRGNYKKPRTED